VIEPDALLILPRLSIQNANAITSHLTWGFPGPNAFLGFVHALHRRISREFNVSLRGVAVVCHSMVPQVSQPSGKRTKIFCLTRNPVGKDGGSAALVEEGRAHLKVSLIIGISGDDLYQGDDPQMIADRVFEMAMSMRIAGGSVLPSTQEISKRDRAEILDWSTSEAKKISRVVSRKVLPGFALVSREKLLQEHWLGMQKKNSESTQLDALLDLTRLNIEPSERPLAGLDAVEGSSAKEKKADVEWNVRNQPGWLVPIPAGFNALSELFEPGKVNNTRDRETPFRFVEGLLTIGQWLSPHRVDDIRHLMWQYETNTEKTVYRCTTPFYANLI